MKIGIIPIGLVDESLLLRIREVLGQVFPDVECLVIDDRLPMRRYTFDGKRGQYSSHAILNEVQAYVVKKSGLTPVLGVVDVDIFVPELNFVFGEATCPGNAALISLWRLKPEFYGETPNRKLFLERAVKEAVHEVGHTLGLRHCPLASCVMHFSNSISDTDIKQHVFCERCRSHAEIGVNELR